MDSQSVNKPREPKITILAEGDKARYAEAKIHSEAPDETVINASETRNDGLVGFLQKIGDDWRSVSREIFHQDPVELDIVWWGGGEKGQARMEAHQEQTVELRNELTEIMDEIDIIVEKNPEPPSDEEIPIEIKDDSDSPNNRLLNKIQELYGDDQIPQTSHVLKKHKKQSYVGRSLENSDRPIYSCTIRSTLNGLEALGIDSNLTEEQLITRFGLESFTASGYMHVYELQKLESLVPEADIVATQVTTFIEAITVLQNNGVIVFSGANEGHSILISGLRNEGAELEFFINDPLSEEGEWISSKELVSRHNATWGTELYGLLSGKDYFRNDQGYIERKSQ